jgi:hypothetical protein
MADRDIETKRLSIDFKKLELEQARLKNDARFFNKNLGSIVSILGVVVSAMISYAAITISKDQLKMNEEKIFNDKQLLEQNSDFDKIMRNKDFEFKKDSQEQTYRLEFLKYITVNNEKLFRKESPGREIILQTILSTFPTYITDDVINQWQDATIEQRQVFKQIQERQTDLKIWFQDSDGDGFGLKTNYTRRESRPEGYVDNNEDPYDSNPDAYPGQKNFFTVHRGDGSFDYNGDGIEEKQFTQIGQCGEGTANPQGWVSSVPNCGQSELWLVDCDRKVEAFPPKINVVRETISKVQGGR